MTQNVTKRKEQSVGRRIGIARKEAGFTVRQIAEALGVDPRTVNRWQSDEVEPSLERLGQIARLLGKSPSYFVEDAA